MVVYDHEVTKIFQECLYLRPWKNSEQDMAYAMNMVTKFSLESPFFATTTKESKK